MGSPASGIWIKFLHEHCFTNHILRGEIPFMILYEVLTNTIKVQTVIIDNTIFKYPLKISIPVKVLIVSISDAIKDNGRHTMATVH